MSSIGGLERSQVVGCKLPLKMELILHGRTLGFGFGTCVPFLVANERFGAVPRRPGSPEMNMMSVREIQAGTLL